MTKIDQNETKTTEAHKSHWNSRVDAKFVVIPLRWRHNEHDCVSNHQRSIVHSTVCSGPDQRKHLSSASLAFVSGIHRRPVNSPHKGLVTRKMFPFDDVIMQTPEVVFMATSSATSDDKLGIMETFMLGCLLWVHSYKLTVMERASTVSCKIYVYLQWRILKIYKGLKAEIISTLHRFDVSRIIEEQRQEDVLLRRCDHRNVITPSCWR